MRAKPVIDVTMLVPGLLGPGSVGANDPDAASALVAGLDLDALDRLLARADHAVEPAADGAVEALAFRAFGHEVHPVAEGGPGGPDVPGAGTTSHPDAAGESDTGDLPRPPGADWPVAAVTALVDCDAPIGGSGWWLRADPVHLRPDIADLVLFDAVDVGVSNEEARVLAEIVNEALRPGGPLVHAAHPHRWYVALEAPARMATTPLSLAVGAGISVAMPRGPDAPRWRRWMNEVQMALHECPVNAERERRGTAPINSVWPWGGGSLPPLAGASAPAQSKDLPPASGPASWEGKKPPPASGPTPRKGRSLPPAPGAPAPFAQVWSDDALVHGLAHHAGIECGRLPGDGASPDDGASPGDGASLDDGASPGDGASRSDAGSWLDAAPRPGAHLITFDTLYRAARRSDLDGWRAGLARFSASWAKPLLDALDRGAVARVSIHDERGHRFVATRRGRFRWWRRGGGLAGRIAGAA